MKKIVSLLFCLLLMSCVLTVHVCAGSETQKHCICGKTECGETGHDVNQEWEPVSSLPTDSGYYYLTSDIELGDSSWTVAAGKDIHLCLNGYSIKTTKYIATAYMIDVLGKLTITDCKTETGGVKSIHSAGMIQVKGGELIINNGNIIHTRHNAHMVHAVDGGKVTINGGKFTNEASELSNLTNLYGFFVAKGKNGTEASEITINDGEFKLETVNNLITTTTTFTPYLINTDTDGKIYIKGGIFNAVNYGYSKYSFDNVTITGGTFNTDSLKMYLNDHILNLTNLISDDYRLKTVTGGYEVEKIEAFKIGAKKYSSLTKALNEANDNDTIVVLEESKLNDSYSINKKIILDLNGFTLEMNKEANQVFDIVSGGKLTIKDSSDEKTGKLSSINKCPTLIRVTGGELVINNGNFVIQENRYKSFAHVVNCGQGKVTLNGGTYNLLEGNAATEDNIYSSVVAATRTTNADVSIININGGTYNTSENTSGTYKFKSRIFTPYKGDDNYDYGTINVSGGYFNGDYNNPDLIEDKDYLNITGGSFDRNEFSELKLKDMIDTNNYYVKESGDPTRYVVTPIPKEEPKSVDYIVVNTCTK